MITEDVAVLAVDLAEKYGLRGFDAIHLASALAIKKAVAAPVIFSSADARLNKAAVEESLKLAG
jgi:predicted nucleic acid-binding protein